MADKNVLTTFIDLEWSNAHNSTGVPISIGLMTNEEDFVWYGEFDLPTDVSQWTKTQVIPKFTKQDGSLVLKKIEQLKKQNIKWITTELANIEWLNSLNIKAELLDNNLSEDITIKIWWLSQEWMEKYPTYHSGYDVQLLKQKWLLLNSQTN